MPKSVLALRVYTAQMFFHDLLAGITVGLVALPLAIAFGIASGVTPQAGLYTAVVAGFLISALWTERSGNGHAHGRSFASSHGIHRPRCDGGFHPADGRDSGRSLLLCGAMEQPSKLLKGARFVERVGHENIMPNLQAALDRAKEVYKNRLEAIAEAS